MVKDRRTYTTMALYARPYITMAIDRHTYTTMALYARLYITMAENTRQYTTMALYGYKYRTYAAREMTQLMAAQIMDNIQQNNVTSADNARTTKTVTQSGATLYVSASLVLCHLLRDMKNLDFKPTQHLSCRPVAS